jgi:hypothetical protein
VERILRRHAAGPEFSVKIVKHESVSSATVNQKALRHLLRLIFFRRSVTSTGGRNDGRAPTILEHFLKYLYHPDTVHQLSAPSPNGTSNELHVSLPVLVVSSQNFTQISSSVNDIIHTKSHMRNTYFQTSNCSYSTPNAFGLN